jgi:prepilin-type N-terminal cleavage/methylation domain-containing protein
MTGRVDDGGFTVPELLVGMVILAIVLVGFGQVLISTSKTSNRVEEQAMLQNEVRSALGRLTGDLREATNAHQTSPVGTATATALTFDSPDRSTPFHLRRISYRLSAGRLERSIVTSTSTGSWPWTFPVTPAAWIPQVTSIQNAAVFTYYDDMGAVTTDPNAVHSVRVTLAVQPKQAQAASTTYTDLVTIRTLQ